MADRPIIFAGPMVRALLNGAKTQTRRLETSPLAKVQVGDRLWVRESWRVSPNACSAWPEDEMPCRGWIDYRAGGDEEVDAPDFAAVERVLLRPGMEYVDWDSLPETWRPSIHQPRWASRLTLAVTDVRLQHLQDISEADALAEGCPARTPEELAGMDARGWFRDLWNSLHTRPGERWDDNPAIVAITFDVHRRNIDAGAAA